MSPQRMKFFCSRLTVGVVKLLCKKKSYSQKQGSYPWHLHHPLRPANRSENHWANLVVKLTGDFTLRVKSKHVHFLDFNKNIPTLALHWDFGFVLILHFMVGQDIVVGFVQDVFWFFLLFKAVLMFCDLWIISNNALNSY